MPDKYCKLREPVALHNDKTIRCVHVPALPSVQPGIRQTISFLALAECRAFKRFIKAQMTFMPKDNQHFW